MPFASAVVSFSAFSQVHSVQFNSNCLLEDACVCQVGLGAEPMRDCARVYSRCRRRDFCVRSKVFRCRSALDRFLPAFPTFRTHFRTRVCGCWRIGKVLQLPWRATPRSCDRERSTPGCQGCHLRGYLPTASTMFYACLSIMILFGIMFFCVTIAIIDLETYNFGLYIVLLCIVGTMLACALCIANPNACANPAWYTKFCLMLQEMYPVTDGTASPKMSGLRTRMMAMQQAQSVTNQSGTDGDSKFPLRQESRATVAMLAPAVHIMHQVWKGMAWVADGIDEEEVTHSYDVVEQGLSTSESHSEQNQIKRLSTIIESSCSISADRDDISSDFTSGHDVMV